MWAGVIGPAQKQVLGSGSGHADWGSPSLMKTGSGSHLVMVSNHASGSFGKGADGHQGCEELGGL